MHGRSDIRSQPRAPVSRPAFASILCAVDATPASLEAARQSVFLAEPSTEITFLAVASTDGDEAVAERALGGASRFVEDRGYGASCRVVRGENPTRVLLDASAESDLLVVGSRERSRAGGVLLGSTASAAVHAAPVSVLAARSAPAGREFPRALLVATDGSADARRGVELAAAIARAQDSRVTMVHVTHGRAEPHRRLAEDAVAVMDATGVEPVTLEESGDPRERIADVARRTRASLLVVGSRGLGGFRPLGSVSERLAHEAPCSVLIVRPGA